MRDPHIFAGNPLDRGERERRDEEWIREQETLQSSRFLPMRGPHVLVTGDDQPRLGWINRKELDASGFDGIPLLLGMEEGVTYFAVDLSQSLGAGDAIAEMPNLVFEEARAAAEQLAGPEAGILAQGRCQINWHNRHGFCSVCGNPTEIRRGGQKRECPQCNAEHFPRVDPVVITVVSDGERCLLGQSRGRLARLNRYSALAGFVDQGESIEEAVAREIMEEAGIQVKDVRYHSSQPWPFPSSLMMGCHAHAATTDIHMDDEEMTDVQWFDRETVKLALEEKTEELLLPGPVAIAYHIIKAWADGEVD